MEMINDTFERPVFPDNTIDNLWGLSTIYEDVFGVDASDFKDAYEKAMQTNNAEVLVEFFIKNDFRGIDIALEHFIPFSSTKYALKGYEKFPYNETIIGVFKGMNEVPGSKLMTDILHDAIVKSYKMYCKAKASPVVNTNVKYEDDFYDAEDWTVEFAEYERQIAEIKQECAARVKEINAKYNERKKEVARKHKITVTNINNAMKLVKMYATTEPENLTAEQKLFLTMYNIPEFCKVYKKSLEVSGIEVVNPEFGLGSNMYDKFEDVQPQQQPKQEEVQHIQRSPLDIKLQEAVAKLKSNMGIKDNITNSNPSNESFEEGYQRYAREQNTNNYKWYLRHIPEHFDAETCKRVSYFFHRYLIDNKEYAEGADKRRSKAWVIRDEIEDGLSLGNKILGIRDYMNAAYEDDTGLIKKTLDGLESIFGWDL